MTEGEEPDFLHEIQARCAQLRASAIFRQTRTFKAQALVDTKPIILEPQALRLARL